MASQSTKTSRYADDDEKEAKKASTRSTRESEPEVEPDPKAITAGTWPTPIDGYRAAVHGVALVGLIPVGDEKTAYPTGTPLGAGKKFWLQNGYYKSATPT